MRRAAALIAAIAAVFALISCSGEKGDGGVQTAAQTETGVTGASQTGTADPTGGKEFVVVRAAREERGTLARAVRLRDMEAEVKLGVAVRYLYTADDGITGETVLADRLAGGGSYDLGIGKFAVASSLFAKGELEAVDGIPNGGAAASTLNPSLDLPGGSYFITGPLVPESMCDVGCVVMNRDTAARFNVKDPAEAAENGEWTWDRAALTAAVIPEGERLHRFAVSGCGSGIFALAAGGGTVTERDGAGVPLVRPTPKEAAEILSVASGVLGAAARTVPGGDELPQKARDEAAEELFSESGALFLFCRTGDIPRFRERGIDFSILPYPAVRAGEPTVSGADGRDGTAGFVPRDPSDPEKTGTVLSFFAEASQKYTVAETYDAMLSGRTSYDGRSRTLLSAVLSGARYETALILAGEDGEPFVKMLSAAAAGDGGAFTGWELKAALVRPAIEAAIGGDSGEGDRSVA